MKAETEIVHVYYKVTFKQIRCTVHVFVYIDLLIKPTQTRSHSKGVKYPTGHIDLTLLAPKLLEPVV